MSVPTGRIGPIGGPGDEDAGTTYAAVGYALSQWERAEVELARLTAQFLTGDRSNKASMRQYGEAAGFSGRMAVLEQAAHAYFVRRCDQALESDFQQIAKRARELGLTRNDITHAIVTPIRYGARTNSDGIVVFVDRFYLVPSPYSARKFYGEFPYYTYDSSSIKSAVTLFQELARVVAAFIP